MSELTIFKENQCVFHLPLDTPRLVVGRSSECDLVLNGDTVSRKHAVIEKREDGFLITDQSSSGTFVNDRRLAEPSLLAEGQRIAIADWVLVFHVQSESQKKEEIQRQTQITLLGRQQTQDATRLLKIQPSGRIKTLKPTLIIDDAEGGQRHFLVKSKRVVIGTGSECDVKLKDRFVSKLHAEFTLSDQGFLVQDRESTNGTSLRGTKIREAYVRSDEVVTLGRSSILVNFTTESEEEVAPFAEQKFCGICGTSHVMRNLFSRIQRVATADMTTLIHGETGSGKEMVARAIHDLSARKGRPYVVLNCGAVQPNLVESELFGHEKGAFTGADQRRVGVFEEASGGTLFLDEIGELPLEMQAKILRVLEYQTLRRVGGQQDIRVDVRVVAATHRNLASWVVHHKFREDLFYRLHVLCLEIPALRDRKEDIELLSQHFVATFSHSPLLMIQPEALDKLRSHTWPGNVRELKNTILRALAFCDGKTLSAQDVELTHIPLARTSFAETLDKTALNTTEIWSPNALDQFERERILSAIETARGDKDAAARILGVGRSTLFRKIKELGIE